jgi:ATP-dependent Lon protease
MSSIKLPLLPLKDIVVFPHMTIPLLVGRENSMKALDAAKSFFDDKIFVVTQKNSSKEDIEEGDLHQYGLVAKIKQTVNLQDKVKILIECEGVFEIKNFETDEEKGWLVEIEAVESKYQYEKNESKKIALQKTLREAFEQFSRIQKKHSADLIGHLDTITNSFDLVFLIISHFDIKIEKKQSILSMFDESKLMEQALTLIESEVQVAKIEKNLRNRIRQQVEKNQKHYYLNEQMKAIQNELGDNQDDFRQELAKIEKKIQQKQLSKHAKETALAELKKLKNMHQFSAEASIIRNYLDFLLDLPWGVYTKMNTNLEEIKEKLEESHYGMKKAKERIYELILQRKRVKGIKKSPILCFQGSPGIGKTTLAHAIGEAIGFSTIRIPLGGVKDEAVLRGHRRTYIGAMPGKILQAIKDSGSSNLVIVLDEIGSMGSSDWRGNPEDVLLEILDTMQNQSFQDHYLGTGFDLSGVIFVATTNSLSGLKPALIDRLEIIEVSGYTQEEKEQISRKYIIPKLLKEHGLSEEEFNLPKESLQMLIKSYTYESGVRGLEQKLAQLIRKQMCLIEEGKSLEDLKDKQIEKLIGHPIYSSELRGDKSEIGVSTGLAYVKRREGQEGEVLYIEAKLIPGNGKVEATGSLGEMMKESTQVAFKYILSNLETYGLDADTFKDKNLYVHFPSGGTPKDGPSAGIAILCAMYSCLKKIPMPNDIAMTGEISLFNVLRVGGIKEKILAAYRRDPKINKVFIPYECIGDLSEVPDYVKTSIEIIPVKFPHEVIEQVFK